MGVNKLPPGVSPEMMLSILGITGMTAYFGLLDHGQPEDGETVLVSGAAGATGSVVGQIAKLKGCRTIGIAGGEKKCAWLTDVAKFDGAIDYKREDVSERIGALCPDKWDIFFDNVAGPILEAALNHLNLYSRVVMCGGIANYNNIEPVPGPNNLMNIVTNRGRMQGFIILDYLPRAMEAIEALVGWVSAGDIVYEVDVQEGFDNIPQTLQRLYTGENFGKQLLRI
jgi:NADPH-dependent curcumin reductase CurA